MSRPSTKPSPGGSSSTETVTAAPLQTLLNQAPLRLGLNPSELAGLFSPPTPGGATQVPDTPASQAERERRIAAIRQRYADMKKQISDAGAAVIASLDSLSEEEAEAAVKAFEEATQFAGEAVDWLDQIMDFTIARIRAGYTVDRVALKKMFDRADKELDESFKKALAPTKVPGKRLGTKDEKMGI